MSFDSLIAEYPPEYCKLIEVAYGHNWMGDGGAAALDIVFSNVNLTNKKILDIGSGLGGAVFHFAKKFQANAVGLEINPWLVQEAKRRTPVEIKSQVDFILYDNLAHLPFDNAVFDIVFSHGVLVHVEDKLTLFKEVQRILKPLGKFYIYDWLCNDSGKWGKDLQALCDMENLTLIPTTKAKYQTVLIQAGFKNIALEDVSQQYAQYNYDITKRLQSSELRELFDQQYNDATRIDLAKGHELIAKSMQAGELLATNLYAEK